MTEINYLELLKAIRECVKKQNYKVGVFAQTFMQAKEAYNDMVNAIRNDTEENAAVEMYFNTSFRRQIIFKNGSIIVFLTASENARGHKFHRVLYYDGIDRELLDCVVRMTEFRYMEE